jgi:rhodanese-related sulfurtransferase
MNIEEIFEAGEGTIVDVRTPAEFRGGSVAAAVNVPLSELPYRVEDIKAWKLPIVVCCASGMRSAQAAQFLEMQGIQCINGGPWTQVNYYQSLVTK